MLLSIEDILTTLHGLPLGLLAALGFIFVVFFLVTVKLQLDALSKYVEKTEKSLHGMYEAIARLERLLGEAVKADEKSGDGKE